MSRKPSILLINRVYPPARGATGRMMQDLSRALVENGWRVTVLSAVDNKQDKKKNKSKDEALPEEQTSQINQQVIKANLKGKSMLGYGLIWWRLLSKARRLPKHDVVLTMTDPPMMVYLGRLVARRKKSKHVHWCQDMYPDLLPALKVKLPKIIVGTLNGLSLKSLKKADQIVTIGQCMKTRIQHKGVNANKIKFIPNWADFEVISPSADGNHLNLPEKITAAARKPEEMFRDNSPKFRVLYAGTIGRAHPMRVILDAASILAEHKEIEFTFVGDAGAHSVLANERAKRGLENIKFIPFQPIEKLRRVMESGDLHLVTMRQEAAAMLVPCKFYSGLMVGRPTIFAGPENTEIADVIHQYECGTVVSPTDGHALAEAIYQYRTDGDVWFNAQEGALQAAQAYHPSRSLQDWLGLLEEVYQR